MAVATGQSPLVDTHDRLAAAVATGTTTGLAVFRAPFAGTVSAARYTPVAVITGVNTNTRKLEIINRGQTGAGTAVAASVQFDAGVNAVAFDEKALTLSSTSANLDVAAGDILEFRSTAVGTGLADPGGLVSLDFSRA